MFTKIRDFFSKINGKHLTIMIIPHTERSIKNINISHFHISIIVGLTGLLLVVASFFMIHLSVKTKELTRLEASYSFNEIRNTIYSNEIVSYEYQLNRFKDIFTNFISVDKNSVSTTYGIGGREIPLNELSDNLKRYLERQKKIEKESNLQDKLYVEMVNETQFINHAASTVRHLNIFFQKRKQFISATPTLWPVATSFGRNCVGINNENEVKILCLPGTPVRASGTGTVKEVMKNNIGLYTVIVDHGFGYNSIYKNLNECFLEEGDNVEKGENFALASSQLIFKIKLAGSYLPPSQFVTLNN